MRQISSLTPIPPGRLGLGSHAGFALLTYKPTGALLIEVLAVKDGRSVDITASGLQAADTGKVALLASKLMIAG